VIVGVCFFFFQAEDGIRDVAVTGVQTCALPIFERALPLAEEPTEIRATALSVAASEAAMRGDEVRVTELLCEGISISRRFGFERSEERRVGKECRWRGGPET